MLHTLALPPFVDALPLPQIVRPTLQNGHRSLTITMREIRAKVHRDVPPTRWWSYGPDPLAPLIEARSGEPIQIRWVNNLPTKHFLPIDYSLHGCGHDVPDVRTTTHLHGAKTPSKDDGYPEDWFTPGQSRICTYPLQQDATALWYHDHAMGLTRLNTYAGLFGMFLLRDQVEDALNLPSGKYEVPLIFYDRNFGTDGQIFYDVSGDPENPWIPEFSADGILINGKIRPYFEVEPRLYRFRLLNTANSRFFLLSLSNGQPFTQIGTDQGLLASPVELKRLVLGCAERADILIDFSQLAGQTLHLRTGSLRHPRVPRRETDRRSRHHGLDPQNPPHHRTHPRVRRHHHPHPHPPRLQGQRRALHGDAHQPQTLARARHRDPQAQLHRDLGVRQPHRRYPPHAPSPGALPDPRPPPLLHQLLSAEPKQTYLHRPCRPTRANELGWKDTVQCPPGTVTRIIVRFEGFTGKYLYHCHILEHESNDMMRPFEVIA